MLRHTTAHRDDRASIDYRTEAMSGRVGGVVGSIPIAKQAVERESYEDRARVAECRHHVRISDSYLIVAVVVHVLR